jgi:hypothetical protein
MYILAEFVFLKFFFLEESGYAKPKLAILRFSVKCVLEASPSASNEILCLRIWSNIG